jgi:hypothetical protein
LPNTHRQIRCNHRPSKGTELSTQRRWLHIGAAAAFSYIVLRLIFNRTVGSQDARAILTVITTAALLVVTVVVFRKVFLSNDKGE